MGKTFARKENVTFLTKKMIKFKNVLKRKNIFLEVFVRVFVYKIFIIMLFLNQKYLPFTTKIVSLPKSSFSL